MRDGNRVFYPVGSTYGKERSPRSDLVALTTSFHHHEQAGNRRVPHRPSRTDPATTDRRTTVRWRRIHRTATHRVGASRERADGTHGEVIAPGTGDRWLAPRASGGWPASWTKTVDPRHGPKGPPDYESKRPVRTMDE
ncbi:hypothetical protein GCM10009677_32390 [Sphaerisporangium rubeum]